MEWVQVGTYDYRLNTYFGFEIAKIEMEYDDVWMLDAEITYTQSLNAENIESAKNEALDILETAYREHAKFCNQIADDIEQMER